MKDFRPDIRGNLSPLRFCRRATLIRRIQLSEQEIKLRQETLLDIQEEHKQR
jgi:hypothetical protein